MQAGVAQAVVMVMFQHHFAGDQPMIHAAIQAHRAPDPLPTDEPPADPFEGHDPHQPPIRTPLNDEPVTDPKPSVLRTLH
jgi:hypothetical protein